MVLPATAVEHYRQQQAIAVAAARQVDRVWRSGMNINFDASWSGIAANIFAIVVAAQLDAAASGVAYVPAVLNELGVDGSSVAEVNPARFMGGTRDGRPLESLLIGSVYESKRQVGLGVPPAGALANGGSWLQGVVLDTVRDANRQAVGGSIITRRKTVGWVRMVNPPSCRFCITLAGKWYRWNQGFRAHRSCDCRHIPAPEKVAGDLTVDPRAYFGSLSAREQDRTFGKSDAQAIRDGADIFRVVNVRSRGLSDDAMKNTPGRNMGWQARRWNSPSLMTVDDVYRSATSRPAAVELLRTNGFILDR